MKKEKIKAVCLWPVRVELLNYLLNGIKDTDIELIVPEKFDEEELMKLTEEARIMIGWRPNEKLLFQAEKLELFINPFHRRAFITA